MNAKDQIERIERRYDPEIDAGIVTWADMSLAEVIAVLLEKVEELEKRIAEMDKTQ